MTMKIRGAKMVIPICLYGTNVWREPVSLVTEFDARLVRLIRDMFETMHKSGGVGLSANQVGVRLALAVVDLSMAKGYVGEKPLVLINPEIIDSEGEDTMQEGCLSIPGVRSEVSRAKSVAVRFIDGNFKEVITRFAGMWARVFQHEYDHLHQEFFVDRLSTMKRQILNPQLAKIESGEVTASYPVVSANHEKKMGSTVKGVPRFQRSNTGDK